MEAPQEIRKINPISAAFIAVSIFFGFLFFLKILPDGNKSPKETGQRIENVKKISIHDQNHWSFLVQSQSDGSSTLMDFDNIESDGKEPPVTIYEDVRKGAANWIEVERKGAGNLTDNHNAYSIKIHVSSVRDIYDIGSRNNTETKY